MARRVRTTKGVRRYGRPVGALISRGDRHDFVDRQRMPSGAHKLVAEASAEDRPQRGNVRDRYSAASLAYSRRANDIGVLRYVYGKRGGAPDREDIPTQMRQYVDYHSPKAIAKARATGRQIKPLAEAVRVVRGKRTARSVQRTVAYNPLSARFVEVPLSHSEGPRQVTRASVARAKARKAPTVKPSKPEYVGRRRAKD